MCSLLSLNQIAFLEENSSVWLRILKTLSNWKKFRENNLKSSLAFIHKHVSWTLKINKNQYRDQLWILWIVILKTHTIKHPFATLVWVEPFIHLLTSIRANYNGALTSLTYIFTNTAKLHQKQQFVTSKMNLWRFSCHFFVYSWVRFVSVSHQNKRDPFAFKVVLKNPSQRLRASSHCLFNYFVRDWILVF